MKTKYLAGGKETQNVFCTQVKLIGQTTNGLGAIRDRINSNGQGRLDTMNSISWLYGHADIKAAGLD